MAFSTSHVEVKSSCSAHPHAVRWFIAESERQSGEREKERGGISNGLWLSSGYWVFDRTPGGQDNNNDRINGQGTMRMSAQQETAVAFELPSDASVIVPSITL